MQVNETNMLPILCAAIACLLASRASAACSGPVIIQKHSGDDPFFDRTWSEFKVGFGSPSGNYWIGNDRLHELTSTGNYKLRFDLVSYFKQLPFWAEYGTFRVGDESSGYQLTVGDFTGSPDLTDAFGPQTGLKFSTKDRDNDELQATSWFHGSCATLMAGGCWYRSCSLALFNAGGFNFQWNRMGNLKIYSETSLASSTMTLVCRS